MATARNRIWNQSFELSYLQWIFSPVHHWPNVQKFALLTFINSFLDCLEVWIKNGKKYNYNTYVNM